MPTQQSVSRLMDRNRSSDWPCGFTHQNEVLISPTYLSNCCICPKMVSGCGQICKASNNMTRLQTSTLLQTESNKRTLDLRTRNRDGQLVGCRKMCEVGVQLMDHRSIEMYCAFEVFAERGNC